MKESQFLKAYDEFADRVFRHCFFRVSDRERAKDITQQAFMKLWEYMISHEEIRNMKALIFRITNNLIVDTYRKKKEDSLDLLLEEGFDLRTDDHESIMNMIAGAEIVKLLDNLPFPMREALVMRYIDDLSPQEIAEITDETENTVSVRIHRALKKVKQLILEQSHG